MFHFISNTYSHSNIHIFLNSQVLLACDPLIVLTGAHCVNGKQVLISDKNILINQAQDQENVNISNITFLCLDISRHKKR